MGFQSRLFSKKGCLNWKWIDDGPLRPTPFSGGKSEQCKNQMSIDRFNETDNRGLDVVAKSLEYLYTTTDMPNPKYSKIIYFIEWKSLLRNQYRFCI